MPNVDYNVGPEMVHHRIIVKIAVRLFTSNSPVLNDRFLANDRLSRSVVTSGYLSV